MSVEWKQFVQNRVNEICMLVPSDCWAHCQGQDNSADVPSRVMTAIELATNELWWNGSRWLQPPPNDRSEELEIPQDVWLTAKDQTTHNLLATTTVAEVKLQKVICCESYSSLSRLLCVIAYVLRFIRLFKS